MLWSLLYRVFAHLIIQEYIDGPGQGKIPSEGTKMKAFVDSMLQDVRSSYRVREEQLASAARAYKKRLQTITKTHNALLIAYRYRCLLGILLHV